MAYNKVTQYGDSENILESEIGLVTKTVQAEQSMASTVDNRKVIKAGALFNDTADTYEAVTPESGDNPKEKGWYTKSGSTYTLTTDTTVQSGTTYYEKTRTATGMYGVVLHDYDMTDYDEKPIAIVVQGRLKADKVSSAAVSAKSTLAAQGVYLV
jgi:hypothetical protein